VGKKKARIIRKAMRPTISMEIITAKLQQKPATIVLEDAMN